MGKFNAIPNFELVDSSLTPSQPGTYEFNATVTNTGDSATTGTVPIHWAELYHGLELDEGVGVLDESIIDFDLNGDEDMIDTFDVTWVHNESRPWDATIDDVHVYALSDHSESHNVNRSYYIDGEPKLFQLGSESHILQRAHNDAAWFAFGASIQQHPSPNFELAVELDASATDFKINGESVETEFSRVEYFIPEDGTPYYASIYIIPKVASEISSGEEVTVSCTLIPHENRTAFMYLIVNWSPDSVRRIIWAPVEDEHTYEAYTTRVTTTTTTTDGTSGLTGLILLLSLVSILMIRKEKRKVT
jgi:hypothetical protein